MPTQSAPRPTPLTFSGLCRREAIDRRFAGDLQAYDQYLNTWFARSWLPAMGLKFKILLNLCVLGFLAPKFMKFEKFPLAYNLRYPTQRIKVRHCTTLLGSTPDELCSDHGPAPILSTDSRYFPKGRWADACIRRARGG